MDEVEDDRAFALAPAWSSARDDDVMSTGALNAAPVAPLCRAVALFHPGLGDAVAESARSGVRHCCGFGELAWLPLFESGLVVRPSFAMAGDATRGPELWQKGKPAVSHGSKPNTPPRTPRAAPAAEAAPQRHQAQQRRRRQTCATPQGFQCRCQAPATAVACAAALSGSHATAPRHPGMVWPWRHRRQRTAESLSRARQSDATAARAPVPTSTLYRNTVLATKPNGCRFRSAQQT